MRRLDSGTTGRRTTHPSPDEAARAAHIHRRSVVATDGSPFIKTKKQLNERVFGAPVGIQAPPSKKQVQQNRERQRVVNRAVTRAQAGRPATTFADVQKYGFKGTSRFDVAIQGGVKAAKRQKRIDRLIDDQIYQRRHTNAIARDFKNLRLDKSEKDYVSSESARRGEIAMAKADRLGHYADIASTAALEMAKTLPHYGKATWELGQRVTHPLMVGEDILRHGPRGALEENRKRIRTVSGIDVRHPLDQGPWWLGANVAMAAVPDLGPVGRITTRGALRASKLATEAGFAGRAGRVAIEAGEHVPIAGERINVPKRISRAVERGLKGPAGETDVYRQHAIDAGELAKTTHLGAPFRKWYQKSARAMVRMAGGDKDLADKFAQVTAVMSSQREPIPNIQLALNAINEWKESGFIRSFGTGPQIEKANAIMRGEEWAGRKTDRFYANMLQDIDPVKYKDTFPGSEVTNDIWMARLFGLKSDVPTPAEYEAMSAAVQRIAKHLGWEPREVQAAMWIAKKAEAEGITIKEASLDFADALAYESAHMPLDVTPSDPQLRGIYQGLTPGRQTGYRNAIYDATRKFLRETGTLGELGSEAELPGAQQALKITAPRAKNLEKEIVGPGGVKVPNPKYSRAAWLEQGRRVAPAAKRRVDVAVATIADALGKDEGFWFKPVYRTNVPKSGSNGLRFRFDRSITPEEKTSLEQVFTKRGIRVLPESDGMYVLNYGKIPNTSFHKLAVETAHELLPDVTGTADMFVYDGRRIPKGQYAHQIERGAASARRSALLRGAEDRLRGRISVAQRDFLGAGGAEGVGRRSGVRFTEDSGPVHIGRFTEGLKRNSRAWNLRELSADELANSRVFLAENGEAGFVVSPEGDLQNVFNNGPKGTGVGADMVEHAIENGAVTLDAYDGFLPRFYTEHGFAETGRMKFNPEYAPDGWNFEADDSPDVVFMSLGAGTQPKRWFNGDEWNAAKASARDQVGTSWGGRGAVRETGLASGPLFGRDLGTEGEHGLIPAAFKRLASEERGAISFKGKGGEPSPPLGPVYGPKTLEESVAEGIQKAKPVRERQEAGYTPQRGKKVGKAWEAYHAAGGGTAGLTAYRKEMAGELTKLHFNGFEHLGGAEEQDALVRRIFDSPQLDKFQSNRAATALVNGTKGIVPTRSDIALLEKVFPPADVEKVTSRAIAERHKWEEWLDVLQIPRTLQSSGDISALMRQALPVMTRHPSLWAQSLPESFSAMRSDAHFKDFMKKLAEDPAYAESAEAGVTYPDVGRHQTFRGGAQVEEAYGSQQAERLPLIGHSARQYTAFLNDLRLRTWKHLLPKTEELALKQAARKGKDADEVLAQAHKDLARYVNSMTGRGPLKGKLRSAAPLLNAIFFSPRLLASRVDLLASPITYARATPYVRRQAMRSIAQLGAMGVAMLYAASRIPGVTVGLDPLSSDFGRIKIGDTRIDIFGGFQPLVKLVMQLRAGAVVSSVTGEREQLNTGEFGGNTRLTIIAKFLREKLSPNATFLVDFLQGENVIGQPFKWWNQLWRLAPMLAHDIYDTEMYAGPHAPAGLVGAVGGLGMTTMTYGKRKSKNGLPGQKLKSTKLKSTVLKTTTLR